MYYCYLETPIGQIMLAGDDDALAVVDFPKGSMHRQPDPDWIYNEKPFTAARQQLLEYFSGDRTEFDLQLRLNGTEFQLQVLEELQRIPYGETKSYGDIAERIGRPKALRAVGAANGRNPSPIPGTHRRLDRTVCRDARAQKPRCVPGIGPRIATRV